MGHRPVDPVAVEENPGDPPLTSRGAELRHAMGIAVFAGMRRLGRRIGQPAVVDAPRIAEARAPGAHQDPRVETSGDRLARMQNYFFTPEFLADVCGELDVPFRTNGHRNW